MALRKSRSLTFMRNPLSAFSLFNMLTMTLVLMNIVAVAFKLITSEKEALQIPSKGAEEKRKKRRRLRHKVPADFPRVMDDAEDDNRKYSVLDVLKATQSTLQLLWRMLQCRIENSVFCVAAAFYPAEAQGARDEMYQQISHDVLRTIAGLKFRITQRFDESPFNLVDLTQDTPEPVARKKLDAFLGQEKCCLDAGWSRPVQADVLKEQHDQLGLLLDHIDQFRKNGRSVTVREEALHAQQRRIASGYHARPKKFQRQAAESVVAAAAENFIARGGRANLQAAPPKVVEGVRKVRKNTLKHSRPSQMGNPMLSFVSTKMRANPGTSKEHWVGQWRNLAPNAKTSWVLRHKTQVRQRRAVDKVRADTRAKDAESVSSPWGMGDADYPLRGSFVSELLNMFQTRDSAEAAIKDLDFPGAAEFLETMRAKKHHSQDVAYWYCSQLMGSKIDEKDADVGTWHAVQQAEPASASCRELHPGLCATADADILAELPAFMKQIPKEDCVLKFQRTGCANNEKFTVFVRAVLGPECIAMGRRTKTPLRMFFAQLELANRDPSPECYMVQYGPHAYKSSRVPKYPFELNLALSPGVAAKQGGMWNQFEFAKLMLRSAKAWQVCKLECQQASVSRHVVKGIVTQATVNISGDAAAPEASRASGSASSASRANAPEDWSFFDDPFLKHMQSKAGVTEVVAQVKGQVGVQNVVEEVTGQVELQNDLDGYESELSIYEDGADSDDELAEVVAGIGQQVRARDAERPSSSDAPAAETGRADPTDAAVRAPKTTSTDFDMVSRALHPRILPSAYRIYHQKYANTYALFQNSKQVKGTVKHINREGGHQGSLDAFLRIVDD
ncbi:unnamed protein product [Symbiodinium sp. CCMP2592]|nr:unnamed protein product [Symbiodinium sp. CCMP2592]